VTIPERTRQRQVTGPRLATLAEPLRRGAVGPGQDPGFCGPDGQIFTPEGHPHGAETKAAPVGPKVFVQTFGCQMNKYDSEMVAGLLGERGARFVPDMRQADLLLMNTCSVRGHAEDRTEEALVAAPLTRSEEVADDRQRDGHDGAGADALDTAEDHERLHRPREPTQR